MTIYLFYPRKNWEMPQGIRLLLALIWHYIYKIELSLHVIKNVKKEIWVAYK